MVFQQGGCVYILTNKIHTVLYVGVSSDLTGRVWDHKNKTYPKSFTAKYNCDKLVYYSFYPRIEEAINAEKTLKGGSRQKKIDLITVMNPEWNDLYDRLMENYGLILLEDMRQFAHALSVPGTSEAISCLLCNGASK